jgi:hypothetical protein
MKTKPTTTRYLADFGTYTVLKTTLEAAEADRTRRDQYHETEVDAWNDLEQGALQGIRVTGRDVIRAEETLQHAKDEAASAAKDFATYEKNRKAAKS